jgi:hypothetical protein
VLLAPAKSSIPIPAPTVCACEVAIVPSVSVVATKVAATDFVIQSRFFISDSQISIKAVSTRGTILQGQKKSTAYDFRNETPENGRGLIAKTTGRARFVSVSLTVEPVSYCVQGVNLSQYRAKSTHFIVVVCFWGKFSQQRLELLT